MNESANGPSVFDPQRWGLPMQAVAGLADRLRGIWARYRDCFKTKTHNTSENALVYLRGLLTMETRRNFVNIAQRVQGIDEDGQNLQQFMSDSPWSGQAVFDQIRQEVGQRPELRGGMLTLDESGDECAGDQKAGAARQYLGREGKVDMGQVGVATGFYKDGIWTMVGAELYLPETWFDPAHAKLRQRWHIPAERTFATKPALGLQLIRQAKSQGLSFEVVGSTACTGETGSFAPTWPPRT